MRGPRARSTRWRAATRERAARGLRRDLHLGARLPRAAWGALALLVLLSALGAGCSREEPPPAPPRQVGPPLEPVRVAYSQTSPALLPYWAARQLGFFARNGLGPTFQEVEDSQAAFAALRTGSVDVYLTPLTPALMAEAADGADVAVLGGTPDLAIVATRRLLAGREFILERFLRSVLEGIHAVQTQPDVARDLLVSQGRFSTPAEAEAALRGYALEPVPYLSAADLEPLIAARAAEDPRAAALDSDHLLDQRLLRRLEASGFVAALYRA